MICIIADFLKDCQNGEKYSMTLGGFHKWRQHPRGEEGLVKCWQNLTLGEGRFDQWWRQQKRTFCCNRNKYKNNNTQLLNLSSNSAILPNMIFMEPKCALGKFLLAATFLVRGRVQSLTNADIGGWGSKSSKSMLTSFVKAP